MFKENLIEKSEATCGGAEAQAEDVKDEGGDNECDDEEEEAEYEDDDDDEQTEEDHKNSLKKLVETNPSTAKAKSSSKMVNGDGKTSNKLEIDESLFNLDDLAELQDELEELDI